MMKGARQLPAPSTSSSSSESDGEMWRLTPEDPPATWAAPMYNSGKKRLSKQLSMKETKREATWDRRTKQYLRHRALARRLGASPDGDCCRGKEEEEEEEEMEVEVVERKGTARVKSLTDEDFDDLRGSIELGFGFSEEAGGHKLCHALPALDLYFAVNRQLSDPKIGLSPSPVSTPSTSGGGSSSSLLESPRSPNAHSVGSPSWRICSPGRERERERESTAVSLLEREAERVIWTGEDPQQVKTRLRHWAQAVACSLMIKNGPGGGTPRAAAGGKE